MKRVLIPMFMLFYMISHSQSETEIFLFDILVEGNQITISNPINVSKHQGYDNQPSFHQTEPILYYSSANSEGRSDIKYFNYETLETQNLTLTNEREYSPTQTPDGNFISCILQRDNGAQDLVKYPIEGGDPIVLIKDFLIGYHAWVDNSKLITYVLLEDKGELRYFDLNSEESSIITTKIGRSLHKIPSKNTMSFVDKSLDDNWSVSEFDPISKQTKVISSTLPQKEDMCWTNDGLILMSNGNQIYYLNPKTSTKWNQVEIKKHSKILNGITRMAINPKNNKLAIVVSE